MKNLLVILFTFVCPFVDIQAQVDPDFYVFLCFGQSNMVGNEDYAPDDTLAVDERFQMLATKNFTEPSREMGQWYVANSPIVFENKRLGLLDYFGRTMVAALPLECKVGVVPVALGGSSISAFITEEVDSVVWDNKYYQAYENNPYARLVEMGKIAQEKGVIKGILLHQGENNCGEEDWPEKVKLVYDRLIQDLGLNAADVPLLAGELAEKGSKAEHNRIISKLPSVIPTAHVISSKDCPFMTDSLHFMPLGFRILGKRYADEMLQLLGYPDQQDADYQLSNGLENLVKATSITSFDDITLARGNEYPIVVTATFQDGHTEDVSRMVKVACSGGIHANGTVIVADTNYLSTVTISYTDFTGVTFTSSFYVNKSNPLRGDLNEDGVIDIEDVVTLTNYLSHGADANE